MPSDAHAYQGANTAKNPLLQEEGFTHLRTHGTLVLCWMRSVVVPGAPPGSLDARKGSLFPGWFMLMVGLCVHKDVPISRGPCVARPVLRGLTKRVRSLKKRMEQVVWEEFWKDHFHKLG